MENKLRRLRYQWRLFLLKIRRSMLALADRLRASTPEICARCNRWMTMQNGRSVQHTSGAWMTICNRCYGELYGEE